MAIKEQRTALLRDYRQQKEALEVVRKQEEEAIECKQKVLKNEFEKSDAELLSSEDFRDMGRLRDTTQELAELEAILVAVKGMQTTGKM